jgi:RNA polymerase sigma factor (sigma-70 family)
LSRTYSFDEQIVKLLQRRDDDALRLIYYHYANHLKGIAFQIVQQDALADDIVQESMVKIWNKSDSYDPKKAKFFTWIYQITRNTALDKLRQRENNFAQKIQMEKSNVSLLEESFSGEHVDIQKHISKLDSKYQEVIELLYFKGFTQSQASEHLDIPLGTVKTRLKIGLRELKKIYDYKRNI